MPAPILAAGITAGANLVGQGINAWTQGKMNRKTREWNEKMYGIQRSHALQDWQMQNAYNDPAAQMARLKAAGLNPNLVYGNGSAAQTAGSVNQPNVAPWKPEAVQFDTGSVMSSFYDTQVRQAQIDNLAVQKELLNADVLLKAAELQDKLVTVDTKKFRLGYDQSMSATNQEFMRQKLNQLLLNQESIKQNMGIQLQKNEREIAANSMNVLKAYESILSMRKGRDYTDVLMENLAKDGTLKDMEIALRKTGWVPGDPWYIKTLQSLLGAETIDAIKQIVQDFLKPKVESPGMGSARDNPIYRRFMR